MASRLMFYVLSLFKKQVSIPFAFAPQGSSAPKILGAFNPGIKSIARSDAGEFLITFTDPYPRLLSHVGAIRLATGADMAVQFGAYTAASGSSPATLVVRTMVADTATDVSADANNVVSGEVIFTNSQTEI